MEEINHDDKLSIRPFVFQHKIDAFFQKTIKSVEFVGLVIISIATVIAGYYTVTAMIATGTVLLSDLLLLFLYLEVLAMVSIYLESGRLPVRMPIYIAIVAVARHLIIDIAELGEWEIIAIACTIFLLVISTVALRFGHLYFPTNQSRKSREDIKDESSV